MVGGIRPEIRQRLNPHKTFSFRGRIFDYEGVPLSHEEIQQALQQWQSGNQADAVATLAPHANANDPSALGLICWFLHQMPERWREGVEYAKKAASLGNPWVVSYFVPNLANNPEAHQQAIDLMALSPMGGWPQADPISLALNLQATGYPNASSQKFFEDEATKYEQESKRFTRHSLTAASDFRDSAVVQAGLLGDLTQREAGSLGPCKGFAPSLPRGLAVALELPLTSADLFAGGTAFGVVGHGQTDYAAEKKGARSSRVDAAHVVAMGIVV